MLGLYRVLFIIIYMAVIQQIIGHKNLAAWCKDKESQKIAQEEIRRALKKSKTKKQRETKSRKKDT